MTGLTSAIQTTRHASFPSQASSYSSSSTSQCSSQESAEYTPSPANQVSELCRLGRPLEAIPLLDSIHNPKEKITAQKTTIYRLMEFGNFREARDVVSTMRGNARSVTLFHILRAEHHYGSAFEVAITMPSKRLASQKALEIVRDLVDLGELDRAESRAVKIPMKIFKIYALNQICWKYTTLGERNTPLHVADMIDDPVQQAHSIVWIHCLNKEFDVARSKVANFEIDEACRSYLFRLIEDIQRDGSDWVGYKMCWSLYHPPEHKSYAKAAAATLSKERV